jgi:hypothetical protein
VNDHVARFAAWGAEAPHLFLRAALGLRLRRRFRARALRLAGRAHPAARQRPRPGHVPALRRARRRLPRQARRALSRARARGRRPRPARLRRVRHVRRRARALARPVLRPDRGRAPSRARRTRADAWATRSRTSSTRGACWRSRSRSCRRSARDRGGADRLPSRPERRAGKRGIQPDSTTMPYPRADSRLTRPAERHRGSLGYYHFL